jgi:hypothetical protein
MTLAEVRQVGEVVLQRYLLADAAGPEGMLDRVSEAGDG